MNERVRACNRLSALRVSKAREPGLLEDGAGLRLLITDRGAKRWVLRLTINGRRVNRGLGVYPEVTLEDARLKAVELRRGARNGRDVRAEEKQKSRSHGVTFREAFTTYFEEAKRPTLAPGRFVERWPNSMEQYVYPSIGNRPVSEITAAEVIAVLTPIWHTRPETASRILQRMSVIFESAILRGTRERASPCTGVRRELGNTRRKVQHRAALPWRDVPAFFRELNDRPRITTASRLALQFIILTACRSAEVRGARWAEIDFDAREWTVPAERMKMKIAHIIPLSSGALLVLEHAKSLRLRDNDLVFPSSVGTRLSDNTLSKLMRDSLSPGTPHGFRSSVKVWASELGVRDEVSEAILAHGDPNKVRAAYRRTTFIADRQLVMENWSLFVLASK